jgi:hypothetical protein
MSNDTPVIYTLNGVPDVMARAVTTTVTGAEFSNGAMLSGTWTAYYDVFGNLLDQVKATFIVSGAAGSTTFTGAGTLPYANSLLSSSYEIHSLSSDGGPYSGLYIDWKGETPGTLTAGTASLYTSVIATPGGTPLRLIKTGVATTSYPTCFLSGTAILSGDREVAVESLQVGDLVSVLRDGALVQESVRWTGSRSLDAAAVAASGIRPIRIRQNAFADAVPHRDLLVTPEHCVLVDGGLVPSRMLVNGRSIVEDDSLDAFSYHHIELERHGILLSEGLTTESYLDTGNRGNFAGADVTALYPDFTIDPRHLSWETYACAPLTTARAAVEPIWQRLDRRAAALGLHDSRPAPMLSDDPEIRVLLDDGSIVCGSPIDGRLRFEVPEGRTPMLLRSRHASPAALIGPFLDDRRELGVKIGALRYGAEPVDLASLTTPGWHGVEPDGRWTDGTAQLPLEPACMRTVLDVGVIATMRYRLLAA